MKEQDKEILKDKVMVACHYNQELGFSYLYMEEIIELINQVPTSDIETKVDKLKKFCKLAAQAKEWEDKNKGTQYRFYEGKETAFYEVLDKIKYLGL